MSKNYIPSPKILFTYLSNITFNWLVIWKMTWGIWQISSRALKIGILMGSFNPKLKKYELKIQSGVICHENEELRKIWREADLSFQSWHVEFDKFWPEHLKVSKIFTFIRPFWANYILPEIKKSTEELSFIKLQRDTKFGEESTCRFKIDIRNLTNFDLSTQKSQRFSL